MLLEGVSQEVPGASQDVPKYVRNTLTSDGSPRYLWRAHLCRVRDAWAGLIDYSRAKNEPHKKKSSNSI